MEPAPATAAASLRVYLLGGFRLEADDGSPPAIVQPRLQFLLAYLLLHRTKPISRQQLAFAFWPDSTEEQAHANLRNLLHRLRDAVPDGGRYLAFDRRTVLWRPDAALALDVADFEAALARAHQAQRAADRDVERQALQDAVKAYAGNLLPDCYDDWIAPIREQLHQAHLRALDRLVLLLEQQHAYAEAIRYAQQLVQQDALHEAAYRHLMRLHLASGDRASALRVYHTCATQLRRELGVDPGPETQAVYQQVLHADAAPRPLPAQTPAVPALVGRRTEWAQLQDAWRSAAAGHPQMVLLAGETGIGKTRLVEELLDWVGR